MKTLHNFLQFRAGPEAVTQHPKDLRRLQQDGRPAATGLADAVGLRRKIHRHADFADPVDKDDRDADFTDL